MIILTLPNDDDTILLCNVVFIVCISLGFPTNCAPVHPVSVQALNSLVVAISTTPLTVVLASLIDVVTAKCCQSHNQVLYISKVLVEFTIAVSHVIGLGYNTSLAVGSATTGNGLLFQSTFKSDTLDRSTSPVKLLVQLKVLVPVRTLLPFVSGNWSCIATIFIGIHAKKS